MIAGGKERPKRGKDENQESEIGPPPPPPRPPLFDLLQRRIDDIRKSGMVNACSIPLQFVTEDPRGRRVPSSCRPRIQKGARPDGVAPPQASGINYCREAQSVCYPSGGIPTVYAERSG